MAKSRKGRRLERLKPHQTLLDEEKHSKKSTVVKQDTKIVDDRNFFSRIYEDQYKKLILIPIILLLLAFVVIGMNVVTTGEFINKGVSLKGGITLTIPTETPVDIFMLESFILNEYPNSDLYVRELSEFGVQKGVMIEASDITEEELLFASKEFIGEFGEDYSIESISSSLGASFFKQTITAVILAFVFMGLVVLWYFRTIVTSGAVVLAAFSDIIITLAIVDLLGMKIGTAGIAAFLMLIGYTVDTNILLSTRVFKRKEGTVMKRIYGAMRTGLTMSITTIVALSIALLISESEVISQIMIILLIGLLVDIINTWIQNVSIIRYYLERKRQK